MKAVQLLTVAVLVTAVGLGIVTFVQNNNEVGRYETLVI